MFDGCFGDSDDLGVHGVLIGIGGLDGQERTCAYMERHLIGLYSTGA